MKRILYALIIFSIVSLPFGSVFAQADANDQKLSAVQKETSIALYPMPVSGTLHIAFNKPLAENPVVLVYDMIGNMLENITVDREAAAAFTVNLSGKRPGFYFIKVQCGEETFSRRITVSP
ncbi:MAG: T9SS type A sorting domain-containing protein [Bacteroidia bacterium]|nr:T9SS type A sorting domain-containing protein [Bacteroidia bacterium]